jgi:hypothetical protein
MVELVDVKIFNVPKKSIQLMDWVLKTGNLAVERDQPIYSQLMFYMNIRKLQGMGLMKCNGTMERSAAKRWSVTKKGVELLALMMECDNLL